MLFVYFIVLGYKVSTALKMDFVRTALHSGSRNATKTELEDGESPLTAKHQSAKQVCNTRQGFSSLHQ